MDDEFYTEEQRHIAVTPNITTVRVFAILNIIFALLGAAACAYAILMAVVMPMVSGGIEQADKQAEQAQAELLADLEQQEADAVTEEEKEQIRAMRQQATTTSPAPPLEMFRAMSDPKLIAYGIADGSTGLILNVMMFISGIGLLSRKEWARRLALWTAGLKIAQVIVMQIVNIMLIVPIQAKAMQAMFDEMNANGAGAPPINMGEVQGMMYTALAIFTVVVCSIYPALTLWFLSRPGAKVVCSPEFEEYAQE